MFRFSVAWLFCLVLWSVWVFVVLVCLVSCCFAFFLFVSVKSCFLLFHVSFYLFVVCLFSSVKSWLFAF